MKTCCPSCQTIFRITPQQLKARAGKVRCGQCRTVFNALDALLEEIPSAAPDTHTPAQEQQREQTPAFVIAPKPVYLLTPVDSPVPSIPPAPSPSLPAEPQAPSVEALPLDDPSVRILLEPTQVSSVRWQEPSMRPEAEPEPEPTQAPEEAVPPMSEEEAQALGKATGLIMPREITEVPGYDKWSSGVIAESPSTPPAKPLRWPYVLVSVVLVLALLGQLAFHFRGELAVRAPATRPALEVFCRLLGAQIPLPRHVELVSIEASDLQADTARNNMLVLSATVRNRATYAQAFPSLELTLTDTEDNAVAKRILPPSEYLPARLKDTTAFAANTDIAVRLWIEARDLAAAGYRLYVFYP